MKIRVSIFILCCWVFQNPANAQQLVETVKAGDLEIITDADGAVKSIRIGGDEILNGSAESGGWIDLAYPVQKFLPLRLGTKGARGIVSKQDSGTTIRWKRLAPRRKNVKLPEGYVSAEVRLRPTPDQRAILLSCRIENHSDTPVYQVLFPDFRGLLPFAGKDQTKLRIAGVVSTPFSGPPRRPGPYFYGSDADIWKVFGVSSESLGAVARVLFMGDKGGLAIRYNGSTPADKQGIHIHRSEADPDHLRLTWEHRVTIEPQATWESGDFMLMAYQGKSLGDALPDVSQISLNGTKLGVAESNGGIVQLTHPATGTALEIEPEAAGLLKIKMDGDAPSLASQYSHATIAQEKDRLSITWNELNGSQKPTDSNQKISAQAELRSAPDGVSVIMRCRVENHTTGTISNVTFPDLHGFKAFLESEKAILRLSNGSGDIFSMSGKQEWPYGTFYSNNMLRWADLGGYQAGISTFIKKWQTPDFPTIVTENKTGAYAGMSLGWKQPASVKPGASWDSGEIWLTPHAGGWAKGIEPFREYVRSVNPPREMPKHIRDGLGFQTIWMMQGLEIDPDYAAFQFKDFPRVALDAKKHGIEEVCVWSWCNGFELPIAAREELGGRDAFIQGVLDARRLGVNFSSFISVQYIQKPERYGVHQTQTRVVYHPELIPMFDPYYINDPYPLHFWRWAEIPNGNKAWEADVLATLTDWIDHDVCSFGWDVYGGNPNSLKELELYAEVRKRARAKYPQAVLAGEMTTNASVEFDNLFLDYTWNWGGGPTAAFDAAPVMNVLRTPRLNFNISDSTHDAKMGFCDGRYLNIMPHLPDQPNGTALISQKPELAAMLKQLAALRRQFLPYFTEGIPLGDSMLSEPAPIFVRGWQRDKGLLIAMVNNGEPRDCRLTCDLKLWLGPSAAYSVRQYGEQGQALTDETSGEAVWVKQTGTLNNGELVFFEIAPQ